MPKKGTAKIAASILISSVVISTMSGCGLFGGDKAAKELDPPHNVSYTEGKDGKSASASKSGESEAKMVSQELYLIDKNGYVVSQTLKMPKTESVAKQSLEYLVDGGPVSNILPSGFRAVLPTDTEVLGVSIKDGTATADFSKEFANYKKEDELKILQAVTWTLTQFNAVKTVKIWINGHELKEMPVNHTPINAGASRADGINLDSSDVVDVTNSHPVTVYYLAENKGKTYYVPVTKRVDNGTANPLRAAVDELISGPSKTSGLLTDFQTGVKLLGDPVVKDGKVTLNFNNAIYGSFDSKKKIISQDVLNSIVLSLTEQPGIKDVAITVNGKADLVTEKGKKLSQSVTRPEKVNTGSF
ncbi:GerMN domain-containing protein [Metabacillus sp. GX 13764]|uniref:GerMN domain-containing protein n=1 Tax=Metabacillus kandeliae TaxID=2900151 RepID=UPI001E5D8E11|nr:GerMN domain-containing protein [Metabacillus kandeliae]MCD7032852.1 GerMN domain-containing protein [Metabacillus kandeliae]